MEFGQPDELKDKVIGGGLRRIRVEKGTNVHRILFGPVKMSTVYYPTLVEDPDEGGFKQALKVLKPELGASPFAPIASLDKRIRKKQGEDIKKSSLDPTQSWLYLVLDKKAENYPKVAVAEYKFSVFDALINLEKEPSIKDPNKLMHGLIFMWDAIIKKTVKSGMSKQFGTRYDVSVDPDNKYSGKVPIQYLGMSTADLTERMEKIGGMQVFFTEEEWEAIEKSDLVLEDEGRHDTPEEMLDKITEFPIFLGATNPDGSYRFPTIDKFKKQLEDLGLQYLEGSKDIPTVRRLGNGEDDDTEFTDRVETVDDHGAKDVEFEEVEEKEEKTESKKKKRTKTKPEKKTKAEEKSTSNDEKDDFPNW